MDVAYVRFAVAHPSHYRVMFGGFVATTGIDPEWTAETAGAFQVLVDALEAQQRAGLVRADDPLQLVRFIWAIVHGITRLAITVNCVVRVQTPKRWLTTPSIVSVPASHRR